MELWEGMRGEIGWGGGIRVTGRDGRRVAVGGCEYLVLSIVQNTTSEKRLC